MIKTPTSTKFDTKTILVESVNMNFLNKILYIYDVRVNVSCVKDDNISFSFFITTETKPHICPRCNNQTAKVHDYRIQKIKDIHFQIKYCNLQLKKSRCRFHNYSIHFSEPHNFISCIYIELKD